VKILVGPALNSNTATNDHDYRLGFSQANHLALEVSIHAVTVA